MMQAIKKEKSGSENQPKPKAGVTPQLLHLLMIHLENLYVAEAGQLHRHIYLRDQVAFLLGYYGLLRRSEIIALQVADVQIKTLPNQAQYIEITIRKSKTDQRGQGAHVCLAPVSRHHIDLLAIFKKWAIALASFDSHPSAAFLPAFNKESNMFQAPLRKGQALATRFQWYIKQLHIKFPFLGLKPELFAMHSFRRGGTTNAWECGVDRNLLKIHGRWRSDAIDCYLQAPIMLRLKASGRVQAPVIG